MKYEEIVATLLEYHIKAVEEDKGEVTEDSMDNNEKKYEDKKKSADQLESEVENLSNLEYAWEVFEVPKVPVRGRQRNWCARDACA